MKPPPLSHPLKREEAVRLIPTIKLSGAYGSKGRKMAGLRWQLGLLLLVTLYGFQPVTAQKRRLPNSFQGKWVWAEYVKDKSELPPIYQNKNLSQVPYYFTILSLSQKGDDLSGKYVVGARFATKVEDGEFKTRIKGNVAELKLDSGFGGRLRVRLTLRGGKLYWKTVESDGENYFPDEIILRKVAREPKFSF